MQIPRSNNNVAIQVITLGKEEYLEAIGFTAYAYLTGRIKTRDLIKGSERSLGEYLEHFVRGKLAEQAFKEFLRTKTGLNTLLDLDLPFFIVGNYLPDVLSFKQEERWLTARFWIEVKAVTERHRWLLIPTTSVRGSTRTQPRPYCAYVGAMVHLPKDHLGRLIRYAPGITERASQEWTAKLADLEGIEVEILGFVLYPDIIDVLNAAEDSDSRARLDGSFGPQCWGYVAKNSSIRDPQTGKSTEVGRDNCAILLDRLRTNWQSLIEQLTRNEPMVDSTKRDMSQLELQMWRAYAEMRQGSKSWFARTLVVSEESSA